MSGPFSYSPGRVWAICDRCYNKLDHAALRKEWTGLLVCPQCYDPRPAQLTPPFVDAREGVPVKEPRPISYRFLERFLKLKSGGYVLFKQANGYMHLRVKLRAR